MKLIKNKRVGKVLLIVEGARHEFNLVKKIFVDILGYTQIENRRRSAKYYVREGDSHSVVAVINTKTSNILSVSEEEYLDGIFENLIEQYDFDINNAAIYYLFDRDPESNTDTGFIANLIEKLKNSRENDDNMRGGMLLLSYSAIEAYEISNFVDRSFEIEARLGSELKDYINRNAKAVSMNKISRESILHAGLELLKFTEELGIEINLDDFSDTGRAVFEEEEQSLEKYNTFKVLSLLSCMLMDLGILVRERKEHGCEYGKME